MKTCAKCKATKACSEFNKRKKASDGLDTWCRDCNKASCSAYNQSDVGQQKAHQRNIEKYGISVEQYNKLLVDQHGVCAICHQNEKHFSRLSVDHCHETGRVSGLLCNNCNRGIGLLNDSVTQLFNAWRYLDGPRED